jgi:hypothetical protein
VRAPACASFKQKVKKAYQGEIPWGKALPNSASVVYQKERKRASTFPPSI